ncbi:MAG: hypothetical protein M1826_003038 [Phylliscum demangeonii]|nr:MAG: hypothetical protein M1826_003038 [Phylliscum demangeonii]
MSNPADDDGQRRRKSTGFFQRSPVSGLTSINDGPSTSAAPKKKSRPASFFMSSSTMLDGEGQPSKESEDAAAADAPKSRSRTLLKSGRPSSFFSALKLQRSAEAGERGTEAASKEPSLEGDTGPHSVPYGSIVLQHGDVQTTGGLFRKRKEHLVLSDTHLLRFKSLARALEAFPSIGSTTRRISSVRHTPSASAGSAQDYFSPTSSDSQAGIALMHVIAVYKLEDGRPFFSVEIAHVDEETDSASSMNFQLSDPHEADVWLTSIRAAAMRARNTDPIPVPQRSVEYVARVLEQERDYDPAHFHIFKVAQRVPNKAAKRASSDDLTKFTTTICYLALGAHKVQLIPLWKSPNRASSSSLAEMGKRTIFGIVTLSSVKVNASDDAFQLAFRFPLRRPYVLNLASAASTEIALYLRRAAEYLRPEYVEQPFLFHLPPGLDEVIVPVEDQTEDHRSLERTLIAHCAAYDIDTSNIRYAVNHDVEDEPQFALLPPASRARPTYSTLEFLAVFRSLRYNKAFRSISFRGIHLDALHQVYDRGGIEHIAWTTRSGVPVEIEGLAQKSLLIQEMQAIAVKSQTLRRMDFSDCMPRKRHDSQSEKQDPGCGVAEALFPLCRRQLTNVDWIGLNGIMLGETDIGYLVHAAVERACHLRALEIGHCGLSDRSLQLILNSTLCQESTLESIDISNNVVRLTPSIFHGQMDHFGYIRKLNLSRTQRTSGPEPLIAPEMMLRWRLEELNLSETTVNEQTIDALCAYLMSEKSNGLRALWLDQCGLTGKDVALLLRSQARSPDQDRRLHLHVSENRLETEHEELVLAIAQGYTPTHLTMQMIEYRHETRFRELVRAITSNTTLKYLDLSKLSLPYDASQETCEAIRQMFIVNDTLQVLDLSGEHAHLEVAKFGIGLNDALTGLAKNRALRLLRIEYQRLGLRGASTLASVLMENETLCELYCEHNDIHLQALTVLVSGLAQNTTLLHLPRMDPDRARSLQTFKREVQPVRSETASTGPFPYGSGRRASASVRRTIASVRDGFVAAAGSRSATSPTSPTATAPAPAPAPMPTPTYTQQDVRDAFRLVNDKWDRQVQMMQGYLERNINLLRGIAVPPPPEIAGGPKGDEGEGEGEGEEDGRRPTTGTSFGALLERAAQDTTPTVEGGDGLAHEAAARLAPNSHLEGEHAPSSPSSPPPGTRTPTPGSPSKDGAVSPSRQVPM